MDNLEFLTGVVVGFLASGLLGFVLRHRRVSKAKSGAHRQPQTVGHQTQQTPYDVVKASRIATVHYVLWTLALGLVVLLFAWLTVRLLL